MDDEQRRDLYERSKTVTTGAAVVVVTIVIWALLFYLGYRSLSGK